MYGPSYAYMSPAYATRMNTWEDGNNTDHAEKVEENHNTWNALLEALTMPGSSPVIQQSLKD